MTDNPWRDLAAKMGPDCKPLIPGLSKPCSKCTGTGTCYYLRFGGPPLPEDAYQCPGCGGTGWLPVSGPEAIVAAQEFILSQRSPGATDNWALTIEMTNETMVQVLIHKGEEDWGIAGGTASNLEPALAQALERAVEEKHG